MNLGNISIGIEYIGPREAEKYLGTNFNNRNLKMGKVSNYLRDMRSGSWRFNGETIKFDESDNLIDGQNRLTAVIESGVTLPFLVVRGLSRATQGTIDTGAARSFGDYLKMNGYSHYHQKASVTNLFNKYETGNLASNKTPSISELCDVFVANPWIDAEASKYCEVSKKTPLTAAVSGTSWGVLTRIDRADAEFFFKNLSSDVGHEEGSPILALRRALINDGEASTGRNTRLRLALVFKAWNKFRQGELVKVLAFKQGGASPENFPLPL